MDSKRVSDRLPNTISTYPVLSPIGLTFDIPQDETSNTDTKDSFISILLTAELEHRLRLELIDSKNTINPLKQIRRKHNVRPYMQHPVNSERHISHQVPTFFVDHPTGILLCGIWRGVVGWQMGREFEDGRFVARVTLTIGTAFEVASYGVAK